MSPWTLQEFSLIPGGAIFLCLVFPQLASGTPPALQSLHQGQTLRPCWDGAAFLLFIFTFLGFSLSFPWVWATQMHFRGAAGMWCRQHCPVLWLCVFQPFWTLRMAAGSPEWGRQVDLAQWIWPPCWRLPFSREGCLAGWGTQKDPGAVCSSQPLSPGISHLSPPLSPARLAPGSVGCSQCPTNLHHPRCLSPTAWTRCTKLSRRA